MVDFPEERAKPLYWFTLLSGLIESLLFTGLAYGWASLVFVLKLDGYFAGYCVNATRDNNNATYTDCSEQDGHFSLIMCVACIVNTLLRFPIGYVFDRCGTTVTRLIAICLFTTGTLIITLSKKEASLLLYPALSCIIVSGTILHITNAQVGNLFHFYRSTIITVYNGAFDTSAAVLLFIKLLHERGVSLFSSFLFLSFCSILLLLRTFLLMPRGHVPYPLPSTFTYGQSCSEEDKEENYEIKYMKNGVINNNQSCQQADDTKARDESKQEEVVSFRSCVLSWLFLWHLLWVLIILFCQFIFLSNVNVMLVRLTDNDQTLVSHYTNAFAFTQLSSVLFAPLNGLILDRHKNTPLAPGETRREADLRSSCLSLFLTSLQGLLFCVCFTCPVLPLQYLTFVLQVISSSFFYGGHQAFISIAFPMSHFGKLSGLAMSLSAVGLSVQVPILHVIQNELNGDPFYVNVAVTLVSLLAFIHPIHVSLYCRKLDKQRTNSGQERNGQLLSKYGLF